MKIDVHAHFADRDFLNELVQLMGLSVSRTEAGQTLMRKGNTTVAWIKDDFFDVDARLRKMDETGVDVRIISLSSPSIYEWPPEEQQRIARYVNDSIAQYCKAHPTRFRGLAVLPLSNTEASLAELDRAQNELGLVGVAMGSNFGGRPMNDPALEPIWSVINQRRIPVVGHPMRALGAEHLDEFELPIRVGFVYETTTALTRMIYAGIFERYPDFPFIVPHTGGALLTLLERLDNGYRIFPDCRQHISRLPSEYARKLYYDTCSFYGPAIMLAHEVVGPERLLWGTDDPFIDGGMAHVDSLPIGKEDKAMILGGNASKIFGITA